MNNSQETSELFFPKIVLITFTMIGIFVKMIIGMLTSSKDGSFGNATTSIWGNLIIIFSVISYICIDSSIENNVIYPLSLLVMMMMWDTTISYKYFERINKKQIPQIYYSWSMFSNLMVLSFLIIMIYNLFYKEETNSHISSILYIIGVFSLFITGVQQTILDHFMVDKDHLEINL